ncbi:MAG: DUF1622 domain-containing protein [Gammaproteobacteria bacterium]|nr:DUF1622 domain-containing protein [Sideroxydans sp.]MBU3903007.1 DUF1622 domain-containing protein [Gammaproteobacteria bacterium]MBU4044913.1 DUF1622 domain-containing protein [Gammaproteobacteria bacterium]MBU4150421.1 DUF1622 domain-containing protein [Gammaproteobacteria bacterium]
MLHELLIDAIAYIVPLTELLGVAVVTWGSVHGLILLLQRGWDLLSSREPGSSLSDIRIAIGEKMALGLDFFLAGDIIGTIVVPSQEALLLLGGIVVIRTVMAYFLAKEIEKKAAE